MRMASSQDVAKAFGKYQDEVLAEEAITVTRYGRPTVVIMSFVEYEKLASSVQRRRVARRAEDMPDELLAKLDEVIDQTKRRIDASESADVPA